MSYKEDKVNNRIVNDDIIPNYNINPNNINFDNFIMIIEEYKTKYNIIDNEHFYPSIFNDCLFYIYIKVFLNNRNVLLMQDINKSNYDANKIYNYFMIYKRICNIYSQVLNIQGFSTMLFGTCYIYDLDNLKYNGYNIKELINVESENNLQQFLTDRRYNPMKILPILNFRHSWDKRQNVVQQDSDVLCVNDLESLDLSVIEQQLGIKETVQQKLIEPK